jgi:hypothetical protein
MRPFLFLLTSIALLTPLTALAQDAPLPLEVPAPAQPPVLAARNKNLPVSVKEKTDKKAREALEKVKVSLELNSKNPEDAFFSLMKQIAADYDIDPAFYSLGSNELDLPERALNMKLTNASAARALDTFCQALGVGWWAEKPENTVMVHLVKLQSTMSKLDMLAQFGVDVQAFAAPARAMAEQATRMAELELAAAALGDLGLSDTRVKAEATTPREVKTIIEELCKQAGLVFAIDSDVPSMTKTLAFENVPIKTALEALCATANLSMSVSKKGEKTVVTFSVAEKNEKPGKAKE